MPNVTDAGAAGPEYRLSRLSTPPRSRSTTCACARPSTWPSTRRRSSTRSICRPASRRRTRSRPRCGPTTTTIKDDPFDPEAAKKLLAEAGFPNGLETDLWAMPVQRPYNPERQAHRRIDAGRSRQDRRQGRDQDASNGASTASALQAGEHQMAHARLDRRQRRSGQLPAHAARLRLGAAGVAARTSPSSATSRSTNSWSRPRRSATRPSAPSSMSRRR